MKGLTKARLKRLREEVDRTGLDRAPSFSQSDVGGLLDALEAAEDRIQRSARWARGCDVAPVLVIAMFNLRNMRDTADGGWMLTAGIEALEAMLAGPAPGDDSFAFHLGQLRHLYALMLAGHVTDCADAARGLLGPAIEGIEKGIQDPARAGGRRGVGG